MSPRDSFWFLAGTLVTAAITVIVRAWLRKSPATAGRTGIPTFAAPIAAALALIGVALGINFLLGSPESIVLDRTAVLQRDTAARVGMDSPPQQIPQSSIDAGSMDDVTQRLAARLTANGGSDGDWKLLAESYDYMGRTAEATAARAHIAAGAPPVTGNSADDRPISSVTGDQMTAVARALDNASPAGTSRPPRWIAK